MSQDRGPLDENIIAAYLSGDLPPKLRSEIAAYLAMPAYSGIYLSRDDVGRMAHSLGLPRGFGERRQLLANLMHSAVQYDQFAVLMNALKKVVSDWITAYRGQADSIPLLEPFLRPWQDRATQTTSLIAGIQDKIAAFFPGNFGRHFS